ncbi:MAG TPA: hypothetical protein VKE70_27710 [Candidatus Solibacter sp.]|nr:hypothetical protein [Candidatus Solibacter sp.]
MIDEEDLIRLRLNRARDPLAMMGPKNQSPQNQQIKSALEQDGPFAISL